MTNFLLGLAAGSVIGAALVAYPLAVRVSTITIMRLDGMGLLDRKAFEAWTWWRDRTAAQRRGART